jgi:transposase-like protein
MRQHTGYGKSSWRMQGSAMAKQARFRCKDCGERFEEVVLDDKDQREAIRERRPTRPIHCPRCRSHNLERV